MGIGFLKGYYWGLQMSWGKDCKDDFTKPGYKFENLNKPPNDCLEIDSSHEEALTAFCWEL